MKTRRPTETDLANMAFQEPDVKWLRLSSIVKPKPIPGSYEPFRSSAGDAVNQQFPFLDEEHPATPLGVLEQVVEKACKGDVDLLAMNLAVARATHAYATEVGLTAERADVRSISLAFGHQYQFGMPLIMRHGGSAFVVFPDLRRSNALTPTGCRFVFSAMHQRWRVNYPDLSALKLSIWKYGNSDRRNVRPIGCLDDALLPYEALLTDVKETYAILHALLEEQGTRRRGFGGSAGPLFGT